VRVRTIPVYKEMSLQEDFERYVGSFENEHERRVGWQFELEKFLLNQMFTLNWAALIGTPAFVAIAVPRERLLQVAGAPMFAFAIGLTLAIMCGALLHRGLGRAIKESDANADEWTGKLIESHTGRASNSKQFENAVVRASQHRKFGLIYANTAEIVGAGSFASFATGCLLLLYTLSLPILNYF
jgi:hypothetical protein